MKEVSVSSRSFDTDSSAWSDVIEPAVRGSRKELAELCRVYLAPIHQWSQGHRGYRRLCQLYADTPEDLTHDFVIGLLERSIRLGKPDRRRGRFRTWLRRIVSRHLNKTLRKATRKKRSPGAPPREPDESLALPAADRPDRRFDRLWAETLVARAFDRVRQDCAADGKAELFARLEKELGGEEPEVSDADLAMQLGLTRNALAGRKCKLLRRMEDRFQRYLRAEVKHTVNRIRDIDDEIKHLLEALD
jgi:DNA-directed RNA polymerase specialized sigma24 family protein